MLAQHRAVPHQPTRVARARAPVPSVLDSKILNSGSGYMYSYCALSQRQSSIMQLMRAETKVHVQTCISSARSYIHRLRLCLLLCRTPTNLRILENYPPLSNRCCRGAHGRGLCGGVMQDTTIYSAVAIVQIIHTAVSRLAVTADLSLIHI